MKRLFVHPDGRLKTGIISVLAFFLILGLADLAFEVKKRSATEVVKVRHVFAETQAEVLPKVVEKAQAEKRVTRPDIPEAVIEVSQPKEVVVPVMPEPEVAKKELVPPEIPQTEQQESEPVVTAESRPDPPPPSDVVEKSSSELDPLVALLGEKETPAPVSTGKRDFAISDDLRNLARTEKTTSAPAPKSAADDFLASVPKRDEPKDVAVHFNGIVVSESEVKIDSKEYNEIFKSWRNAGSQDEGKEQLSFRVQNLRKNYQLLQMKPVVVRTNRYFDLLSGAPLPGEVLAEYSSLQLVVEKPWQEWQAELSQLGLHASDDFSVRYLLYASIDRAMQHRVNRAYECTVEQGLLPAETSPSEVEIVGRVYQISRNGGGRFGVFVPQTLSTKTAQQIAIPVGQCFATSADVQMLMAAGVL